jgi:dTDP-glucose 4,6-dehydratase
MNELGWTPQYDFERAMKETVEWYQENEDWWRKIKEKRKDYIEYYKKQYEEVE